MFVGADQEGCGSDVACGLHEVHYLSATSTVD